MVTAHPPLRSEAGIVRAPSVASAQEPAGTMALEPSPFPRSGLSAALALAEGETEAWRSALGARLPGRVGGRAAAVRPQGSPGYARAHLWNEDMMEMSRGHPVWLQPHQLPLPLLPAPADTLAPPNLCLRALSAPSWAQASLQIATFPRSSPAAGGHVPSAVHAQASFPLEACPPPCAGLGVQRSRFCLPPAAEGLEGLRVTLSRGGREDRPRAPPAAAGSRHTAVPTPGRAMAAPAPTGTERSVLPADPGEQQKPWCQVPGAKERPTQTQRGHHSNMTANKDVSRLKSPRECAANRLSQ